MSEIADLLDITGTEGLLGADESRRWWSAHSLVIGLERLHAGRDQQRGRIPFWNQWRAGKDQVIPAGEER